MKNTVLIKNEAIIHNKQKRTFGTVKGKKLPEFY